MNDETTQRMIALYMEEADSPMFLSGFFGSPPRNFHTSELVTIDIERDDEDVAIVIQDLGTGARANEFSRYTNKGFTPPIYDEEGTITSYDMIRRQPGQDPFQDPNYAANAAEEAFRIFRRLERKIRRAIELMASQVFQTGTLTLKDKNGTDLYTLDFSPKATHFVTVGTSWDTPGDPLGDIDSLATVLRRDGKKVPNVIIFGSRSWTDFLADPEVQAQINLRRAERFDIRMPRRGEDGASFHGRISVGQYVYEIFQYDGFFRDPETGLHVPFVDQDNVIILADSARLDLTFGAIPMIRPPEERALTFLPPRMSDGEAGLDLTTNAWFSPDGKHLKVSAGTRPLTIPTAIDTFGTLTTR